MMVDLTSLKDEHLLARFGAGEVGGLGVLAERHEGHLVGLATGLLDGRGDVAQDVVQGAWLRVIRYGKRFEGRSSFRTWMYRIVINGCRDVRARARELGSEPLPADALGEEAPEAENPLRLVAAGAAHEQVRAALRGLSPPVRLLLLLCYHRGLTHPQAAEVMGIPVGTLKSRLNAALSELRTVLGEDGKRAVMQ